MSIISPDSCDMKVGSAPEDGANNNVRGRDPILQLLQARDLLFEDRRVDRFDQILTEKKFAVSPFVYQFGGLWKNTCGWVCCLPLCSYRAFVQSGEIHLVKDGAEDKALGPGYHSWSSLSVAPTGKKFEVESKHVQSGRWVLVNVAPGTLMILDFMDGSSKFLAPGAHQWADPSIVLRKDTQGIPLIVKLELNVIQAQPFTIINVFKNQAMIIEDAVAHAIVAYAEGIHIMEAQSSKFLYSLDLKDQPRQLMDIDVERNKFILQTTSADSILVQFQVNYCFRIKDPQLAAERLGNMSHIEKYINNELLADVTNYIRMQSVSDLIPADTRLQGGAPVAVAEEAAWETAADTGEAKARAVTLPENWDSTLNLKFHLKGIELEQPGMSEFKIADQDAREALRQVAVAKVTALAQLESADTQAKAEMIKAKGEANVRRVTSEAEATAIITIAEAQKDAVGMCEKYPVAQELLLTKASADLLGGHTKWIVNSPKDLIRIYEKSQ